MDSFTIGGLQIHSSTGLANFFLLQPIEGLESPEYRIDQYDKPGEDGSVVSSNYYGGRVVTLRGKVHSDNKVQYSQLRQQLLAVCRLARDSNGYPVPVLCEFTTPAGDDYFFYAIPRKPRFRLEELTHGEFMISLIVERAGIYKSGLVSSGTVSLPAATGLTFPVTFPATFGGTTGGSVIIDNTGDLDAEPVLTLTGQLTNPYILNATTGKIMQLNYTLAGGSTIVIDMLAKTILLNGTSPLLYTKTSDSDWWVLAPESNTIAFNSGSSGDTGTLQIEHYGTVGGV